MRFDTPVRFVKMADVYDESTGNYSSSVVSEVTHYARK